MKHPAIWVIVPSGFLLLVFTLLMLNPDEIEVSDEPLEVVPYSLDEMAPLPENRPRLSKRDRSEEAASAGIFQPTSPTSGADERRAMEYAVSRASSRAPRAIPVPPGTPPVSDQRPPRQFLTVGSIDLILADPHLNSTGATLDIQQRTELFKLLSEIERDMREAMREHVQVLDDSARQLLARGETIVPDKNGLPPEPRFEGELIRTVAGANGPEYVRIDPADFPRLSSVQSRIEHKERVGVERVQEFLAGAR